MSAPDDRRYPLGPEGSAVMLADFRDHLRTLGLAPRSAEEYMRFARRLARWCDRRSTTPAVCTVTCIADWGDGLPRTWATRKQAFTATHHLLLWLGRDDGAWRAIHVPRKPQPAPRALEPAEARRLRDAAVLTGGRAGLAVLIGLHTGARAAEIAGMRWDGIDPAGGRIRWQRVKGGGQADLPLHPTVLEALADHPRTGDHLFPGDRGRPHVSPSTVWGWVKDVGRIAGVNVTTHQLRHTMITEVYDRTKDLRAAQEAAGHRSPTMTAHYTRIARKVVDAAVLAVNYDEQDTP